MRNCFAAIRFVPRRPFSSMTAFQISRPPAVWESTASTLPVTRMPARNWRLCWHSNRNPHFFPKESGRRFFHTDYRFSFRTTIPQRLQFRFCIAEYAFKSAFRQWKFHRMIRKILVKIIAHGVVLPCGHLQSFRNGAGDRRFDGFFFHQSCNKIIVKGFFRIGCDITGGSFSGTQFPVRAA